MGTLAVRRRLTREGSQPVHKVDPLIDYIEPAFRTPDTFKPFSVTVASVGTPQTIWTPTSGLRWRAMGYTMSASAAGAAVFKEASVAASVGTRFVTAKFAANGTQISPPLANGFFAASRNNQLVLDSDTAGVTYAGTVFGTEEAGE
jgi:hypothetical protein